MKKTVFLVLILLAALAARLWGINFGLPNFFFHSDENLFVNYARQFVQTGQYPSNAFKDIPIPFTDIPFINILSLLIRAIFKGERTLKALGLVNSPQGMTLSQLYLLLRIITAIVSTLTVLTTYKVASKIYNRTIGLLAALVLATTFLEVQIAHYTKQDSYLGFLSILTLFFGYKILLKGRLGYYLLTGSLIGLATVIKPNGSLLIVNLLSAHLLRNWEKIRHKPQKFFDSKILLAIAVAGIGTVLGHSYEWFGPFKLVKDLSASLIPSGIPLSASSANGIPTPVWWIMYLASSGLFYPLFTATIGGIFLALKKHGKKELFLLSFPICYFTLLSAQTYRFDRYAAPLTPYFSIFSALLLFQIFRGLWAKKGWPRTLKAALISLTIVTFIGIPAGRILAFDYLLAKKDTREVAIEWVENNINKDEDIVLLGTRQLRWELGRRGYTNITYDRTPADDIFDFRGGIFIVAGSIVQEATNYRQTDEYKPAYENLRRLFESGEVLAEFSQPLFGSGFFSPPSLEHSATVNAYHQPPIWILRLPQHESTL